MAIAPAGGGTPFFQDGFSPQQPGWSFPSPSSGYLGELNNNLNVSGVTLTVNVPAAGPIILQFDLLGYHSIDGLGSCCGPDTLGLAVNGHAAFTGTWTNPDSNSAFFTNPSGATYGPVTFPMDLWLSHRLTVPISLSAGANVFAWSYTPLQDALDEGWGLDNVVISGQLPTCAISDVAIVSLNASASVDVQSGPGTTVDLEVVRSGNGRAVFDNGSTSLSVTGPATVGITGVQASNVTADTAIVAQIHGDTCDMKRFTVLDVTLSINSQVSSDNSAGGPLFPFVNLGVTKMDAFGAFVPVEIQGTVRPSNFDRNITLKRIVNARSYKNGSANGFSRSGCGGAIMVNGVMAGPDTSCPNHRDDDPRPNGNVYDTDAPGVVFDNTASLAVGTVLQWRANFYQFAVVRVGNRDVRVSSVLNWFVRVTVRKVDPTANVWALDFSRPGDNTGAVGWTNLAP